MFKTACIHIINTKASHYQLSQLYIKSNVCGSSINSDLPLNGFCLLNPSVSFFKPAQFVVRDRRSCVAVRCRPPVRPPPDHTTPPVCKPHSKPGQGNYWGKTTKQKKYLQLLIYTLGMFYSRLKKM